MPRADGTPLLAEILAADILHEAGQPNSRADAEALVARLRAELGELPTVEQMEAAVGIVRDPREGKPWPPEEDCAGCDLRREGPHRFGCSVGGARQLRLSMRKA